VLIECAASLAPESRDEYEQAYGPNGSCWLNGPSAWAACRDFCTSTLEALNLVAMVTGDSCGTCSVDTDCSEYGFGASCVDGLCTAGSGSEGSEGSEGNPDEAPTDGPEESADGPECYPPAEVCEELLACLAVVLPDVDVSDFEADGECWCNGPEQASECEQTCISQLEAAEENYPTIEECAGPIDPCPNATEGCECEYFEGVDCEGNLLCEDGTCVAPEFGACDPEDELCPANGCANGVRYWDKSFDDLPDFAVCYHPCEDYYDCLSLPGGFIEAEMICSITWGNCLAQCYEHWDCPSGSVCSEGACWYDLP
jgi:hypothetical protein